MSSRLKPFYFNLNDNESTEGINKSIEFYTSNVDKELIKWTNSLAEEGQKLLRKILILNILNTNNTNRTAFLNEVIESTSEDAYNEFCSTYDYDVLAGTRTNIVLNNSELKRNNSRNVKYINKYQNNRFAPIENKKTKKTIEHHFIEILTTKQKLVMKDAILVSKAFGNIKEKKDNGDRFAQDTSGSYSKLNIELQKKFFNEFQYEDNDSVKKIGYEVSSTELSNCILEYLVELNGKYYPINKDNNVKQYLQVHIASFKRMSLYSQIALISNLSYVDNYTLYVKLNHQQDIGNCGRRYNTLNNLARNDRKEIQNLYGYDMETAIQVILVDSVNRINSNINLFWTSEYISNKNIKRQEISKLMNWDIDRTKMEITAIYQGRNYNKRKYESLKHIFNERDVISEIIFETRHDIKSQQVKYAVERTNIKAKSKYGMNNAVKDYSKIDEDRKKKSIVNTYMFFYWTYIERQIQNIIARNFRYPITLHDAVYTQDKIEFDNFNLELVKEQIRSELGLSLNLGVA